jgi:hypothetical protein
MTAANDISLFSDWLEKHHRGITDSELTAAVRDVISEVVRQQKPGQLVLTVKIAPLDEYSVTISGRVDSKLPKEEARAIHYFVDDQSMPTRRDPQQPIPFDRDMETTTDE